jgi:4-amino-4-deoxy-L-arabinose transferase-like glycosyltransferase
MLGVALVGTSTLAGACCLRLSVTGTLLAAYVLAVGQIIVTTDLLSLVHQVGRAAYVTTAAAFTVASLALWWRQGRPFPTASIDLRAAARHPAVAVLALAVALALGYELLLALTVPPNTWDAMTYHLTRAAAWLQNGGIAWVPAATIRVNVFPVNGEIQILWTLALAGTDVGAALPQFVAQLATIVAIFGIGRRLGFSRPAAAYAALLFATLAEIALEATSTQNDLAVAAPVAIALYFILGRNTRESLLAATALGIALGTKLTAAFALPCLVLVALLVLPRRQRLVAAVAAAAAFIAFASPTYIANLAHTGKPLGAGPRFAGVAPRLTLEGTISTVTRIGWRFIDFTGLRTVPGTEHTVGDAGSTLFHGLHIPENPRASTSTGFSTMPNDTPQEDVAFFGPLGALLILPIVFLTLAGCIRRRARPEQVAVAAALPLFVLAVAFAYRYNLFLGRFMVVPVALVTPLIARIYSSWRLVATLVALVAVTSLQSTLANNTLKPLASLPWAADRVTVQTAEHADLAPTIRAIDADVPRGPIGYAFGPDDWTYPLYGAHFQRHPVLVGNAHPFADAIRQHLVWLVVSRPVRGHASWRVVQRGTWTLLHRRAEA